MTASAHSIPKPAFTPSGDAGDALEKGRTMEEVRIWAGLQGFMSAAALLALLLFFAMAMPFGAERRQWSWLGPVNDWLSVLGATPWIVAMVLLAASARVPAWVWVATGLIAVGIIAGAVVTVLMLAGRATLELQAAVFTPVAAVGFAWIAVVGTLAANAAVLPRWVAVCAVVLAIALAVGGAIVAVGFLLPESGRMPLFVIGATIGGLSWIGFPVWWLMVASTAR